MSGLLIARAGSMAAAGKGSVSAPVTFDSAGATATGLLGFNPSITTGGNYACSGLNRALVIFAAGVNNGFGAAGQTYTATYGGVEMTTLAAVPDSSGGTIYLAAFGMLNPPTGTQAWVAGCSGGGNTGRSMIAYPQSYNGVGSFGPVTTAFGPSSPASLTVTSAVNEMIAQAFEAQGAFSSYSATLHGTGQSSGVNTRIEGGDAAGASSVTFTAAMGAGPFAGAAVRLLPV